jgi:hypothetical protein
MWIGTTEATQAQTSLWANPWVWGAFGLWLLALVLIVASLGRLALQGWRKRKRRPVAAPPSPAPAPRTSAIHSSRIGNQRGRIITSADAVLSAGSVIDNQEGLIEHQPGLPLGDGTTEEEEAPGTEG